MVANIMQYFESALCLQGVFCRHRANPPQFDIRYPPCFHVFNVSSCPTPGDL